MEKQLKDYLPYYIGQRINTPEGNMKLASVNCIDWFVIGTVGESGPDYDCAFAVDNVNLILRRLEDLTDEEKKQIWLLIFGRPFRDNGSIRWIDKEDRTSAKRWVMSSGLERVGIEMSGQVWADSDLSIHKFNPHIITHHLCSIGIDLFGLIDAELAVDAKTL